jgi:hypothetical protein
MSSFTITSLENINETDDGDLTFEDLYNRLNNSIYSWHENLSSEIEKNEYLNDLEELSIDIKTCSNLVISLTIYEEMLCEASGISYLKETEAKYSLLDIFNTINNLINKNKKMKKGTVMIFSVLLFKTLEKNKKFQLNINQITNKVHPIISMIFCNELHKQIKELGVNKNTTLILENLTDILERKIKEEFITM